jgi:hypothetical protein
MKKEASSGSKSAAAAAAAEAALSAAVCLCAGTKRCSTNLRDKGLGQPRVAIRAWLRSHRCDESGGAAAADESRAPLKSSPCCCRCCCFCWVELAALRRAPRDTSCSAASAC